MPQVTIFNEFLLLVQRFRTPSDLEAARTTGLFLQPLIIETTGACRQKAMSMKKIGILSLLIALAFSACRENVDEAITTETPFVPPVLEQWEQPVEPVQASLTGFVTDETGQPVADAQVEINGLSASTDAFGHFFFENIGLNARGSLVRVHKEGYFPGSRRFFPTEGTENRVRIQLIPQTFDYSFSSDAGGAIVANGGAKVVFEPGSIARADGTPYDGVVQVAARWLNPNEPDILNQMPGNLQGVDFNSEEVALTTAGMMAVELQSEAGDPLNLLEGYTATISMPVPDFLQGNAPAEVPNWSYNEEYGMWVEEGVSRLQGDAYVGEVSHFSYWNHDFKDPLISFSAVLQDEAGNPLGNYRVIIRQPGTNLNGFGHTGADGSIAGLIPQDYDLLLEVMGNCGEVIYSENIGPFSGDVDLGVISVPDGLLNAINLTGTLVDCEGNPLPDGILRYEFGNYLRYEYLDEASFDFSFSACEDNPELTVIGISENDLVQSEAVTVQATTPNVNLGLINVCEENLEDYVRVTVDGDNALYMGGGVFPDSIGGSFIYHWSQEGTSVSINFAGATTGDYSGDDNYVISITDESRGWNLSGNFENFEVTAFGTFGEPVIGTFSGTLTNNLVQPPEQVSVSGDFNLKRQ
jgi:hypothetical protein